MTEKQKAIVAYNRQVNRAIWALDEARIIASDQGWTQANKAAKRGERPCTGRLQGRPMSKRQQAIRKWRAAQKPDFGKCGHCDSQLDNGSDCGHCGYSGPPETGDRTTRSPFR